MDYTTEASHLTVGDSYFESLVILEVCDSPVQLHHRVEHDTRRVSGPQHGVSLA